MRYTAGDVFIRNYGNVNYMCLLMSRDLEKTTGKFVWTATMLPIANHAERDRYQLHGGSTTVYYDEDLLNLKYIGRLVFFDDEPAMYKPEIVQCDGGEGDDQ